MKVQSAMASVAIIRHPVTGSVQALGSADDVAAMIAELFRDWCAKYEVLGSKLMVFPEKDGDARLLWCLEPMNEDDALEMMLRAEEKQNG
jgi:hypothetical protein